MIIQSVVGYINGHLLTVMIFAALMAYALYTLIKDYSVGNKMRDKRKMLKKELADLEVKYSEKTARLEARLNDLKEKLKEKDKFLKRGK